jgi:hypothetical protein
MSFDERACVALERIAIVLERLSTGTMTAVPQTAQAAVLPAAPRNHVEPASDDDLDGQYGDPEIKFGLKAKYWKEQPDQFQGKHYSECTPKYLKAVAQYKTAVAYMADKEGTEESEKKSFYAKLDAGRAIGWAKRIEAGWKPSPPAAQSGWGDAPPVGDDFGGGAGDDDIPF